MARTGEVMFQLNRQMFEPTFNPPKKYRRLIQYFMIGACDNIPFEQYMINYLRSQAVTIRSVSDLKNWIDIVNQNPPGTPLVSRPYGIFETFMGVAFYTNPLRPGTINI